MTKEGKLRICGMHMHGEDGDRDDDDGGYDSGRPVFHIFIHNSISSISNRYF